MVKVNGLSQAALGRALNLSPPAVTKLKQQGMPVHSVEAAQAWREAKQNIAQRKAAPASLQQLAAVPTRETPPPEQPRDDESFDQARKRREIIEANRAALRLAEEKGELIRADLAEANYVRKVVELRQAILQLTPKVAPLLVGAADLAAVNRTLQGEVNRILSIISGQLGEA